MSLRQRFYYSQPSLIHVHNNFKRIPKTINIIIVTQLPNSSRAPILRKPPAMNVSGYWYLETIKAIPNKNIAILKGKGTNL